MKKTSLFFFISLTFIACQNEPEKCEDALFVEPYLGWGASKAEVRNQMEKRGFVFEQDLPEYESMSFYSKGKELFVQTEIMQNQYYHAYIPFDTTTVPKVEIENFIKKHYQFVRSNNGVNVYCTADRQTLLYAASVYNDQGNFVWHVVTFGKNPD